MLKAEQIKGLHLLGKWICFLTTEGPRRDIFGSPTLLFKSLLINLQIVLIYSVKVSTSLLHQGSKSSPC